MSSMTPSPRYWTAALPRTANGTTTTRRGSSPGWWLSDDEESEIPGSSDARSAGALGVTAASAGAAAGDSATFACSTRRVVARDGATPNCMSSRRSSSR